MEHLLMRLPTLEGLPNVPELPAGFVLRTYEPGDLKGLAALLDLAFTDMEWNEALVTERLLDAADVKKTFVIEHDGVPVATASVRIMVEQFPGSGYLHWVAVHPDFQGKDLGRIVTLAALHEFATIGCKDAVLETQDQRLPAIKLYKKLGFEEVHAHASHSLRWAMIAELLASANV